MSGREGPGALEILSLFEVFCKKQPSGELVCQLDGGEVSGFLCVNTLPSRAQVRIGPGGHKRELSLCTDPDDRKAGREGGRWTVSPFFHKAPATSFTFIVLT